MTMLISFFKNTGELERINKQHTRATNSKVIVVVAVQENQKQHEWLLNHKVKINKVRQCDVMEKQTD